MKKIKSLKTLLCMLAFCMYVGAFTSTAHANPVDEVEPNDTMDTAQEIEPNKATAVLYSEGKQVLNPVWGTISEGDHDWYKVYLKSGKQYITLSSREDSAVYDVILYKENGEFIDRWTHVQKNLGMVGYDYDVTEGYHYIEVIGKPSYSGKYTLSAGDPWYYYEGKSIAFDITMSGGKAKTVSFDWSMCTDISKKAVVDSIRIYNANSTSTTRVTAECEESRKTINMVVYPWEQRKLCNQNLKVKSKWNLTFGYRKDVTITPKVTIMYFYPIEREGEIKKDV